MSTKKPEALLLRQIKKPRRKVYDAEEMDHYLASLSGNPEIERKLRESLAKLTPVILQMAEVGTHIKNFPVYEVYIKLKPFPNISNEFRWALAVSQWLNDLKKIIGYEEE